MGKGWSCSCRGRVAGVTTSSSRRQATSPSGAERTISCSPRHEAEHRPRPSASPVTAQVGVASTVQAVAQTRPSVVWQTESSVGSGSNWEARMCPVGATSPGCGSRSHTAAALGAHTPGDRANTARAKFAMLLLAQVSGFQLPALRREPTADAKRFSRTAVVQCRASQCREPLLYVPRSFLLRTTAVQCTEPYVPYVPSRKPYVPSWSQGGSSKKNVYAEQQTEYEEYAKALQGRASESEDSRDSPLAPPSLEAIEGALRAALAPVRLRCENRTLATGPLLPPLLARPVGQGRP